MRNRRTARFSFFLFAALLLASSCVKKSSNDTPEKPGPEKGSLFVFDYGAVDSLQLVKNDPESNDRWSARLKRISATPFVWEIANDPESGPLLDRVADDGFVGHLLDTFNTLQVIKRLPSDTPFSNIGLEPPRYAIHWTLNNQEHQILIGSVSPDPRGVYGHTDLFDSRFVLDGATIGMFTYLKSFDVLRKKTVITFTSDSIDQIQFKNSAGTHTVERLNGGWADSKSRKTLRDNFDFFLESLIHLQIDKYIDDPKRFALEARQVDLKPEYSYTFEGRNLKQPVSLKIKWVNGHLLARVSNRPNGLFLLFDESEAHLDYKL